VPSIRGANTLFQGGKEQKLDRSKEQIKRGRSKEPIRDAASGADQRRSKDPIRGAQRSRSKEQIRAAAKK
jgi:hypothetical protein